MRAPAGALRRSVALATAATLGGAAALGLAVAPAAAAVGAPTNLMTADRPCAAASPGPYLSPDRLNDARAVVLRGTFARAGAGDDLDAEFQVWDVTDPAHPQQWLRSVAPRSDEVYVQLEDYSRQLDGVTYAWRVRVLDAGQAGPWSDTCHFTVDRDGGSAPTVTSAEYPAGSWDDASGGIGHPGAFTLTSTNDDTVRYRYEWYADELGGDPEPLLVDAERVGGPATVRFTPRVAGVHWLAVRAIDRAGNYSPPAHHIFVVTETRPSIFSAAYPDGGHTNPDYNVGVPGAFELRARVADTVSFGWRIDQDGPSGTVPANPDGTATVMITPVRGGRQTLYVHSITRDGTAYPARAYEFLVDNSPRVTGDTHGGVTLGSSLTFRLAPRAPRVQAYLYWPVDEQGEPGAKSTVAAAADGTAVLTWTATDAGVIGLRVQSRSADGTLSEARWIALTIDAALPTVTRTGGTDLGTAATFVVRTRMANVVEYVAVLNNQAATTQVLRPSADGSATFRYTPAKAGHQYVTVVARNAAGVRTGEGIAWWIVTDGPRVTSTDFPENGRGRPAPGTFTFTPRLPGTTAYEYSVNWGGSATVAARPDGTATLTWTPADTGPHYLTVRSVTAGGARSLSTTMYAFTVEPAAATVTTVAPATVPAGGVRTITVRGTGLHPRDVLQVSPATGQPLTATVRTVTSDGTTMTAEVNLAAAPTGRAGLTLTPYGGGEPVTVADALTIGPPPAMRATAAPTITGTVAVGGTVRATAGTWTPGATALRYQWSANGVAITGATGSALTLSAALLGKRLTVAVTASRAGYTSARATSAPTGAVARGAAPRATTRPKVAGTPRVGRTVTADVGAWTPRADSYRYQWRVNGKLVSGATGRTLKLTAAMNGKRITVTVTARRSGHADGRATSAAVTVRR